jgi:hypothetical protein
MSFYRHLFASALLSGTVFAASVLPLAAFGSKPLAIQLEGRPVFTGQFKDLSGSYLSLALALSIGAGVANLAVLRWYQSSRRLGQSKAQLSALEQQLAEKDSLIEALRFSPTRLQASGLERFLDNPQPQPAQQPQPVRADFVSEPIRNERQVAF